MSKSWSEIFYLRGIQVTEDQIDEVAYPYQECMLCGASVSVGLTSAHDQFHADTPALVGSPLAKRARAE